MVLEYKIGLTVQNMLEIGKMIEQMEKGNYTMPQEIYMKVNGKMIKLMEKEHIIKKMVENMKVIGLKINNMDME